jgi:hypothetical protein
MFLGTWVRIEPGAGMLHLRPHALRYGFDPQVDGRVRAGATVNHGVGDQFRDQQPDVVTDAAQPAVHLRKCRSCPPGGIAPARNREMQTLYRHIEEVPAARKGQPLNRPLRPSWSVAAARKSVARAPKNPQVSITTCVLRGEAAERAAS